MRLPELNTALALKEKIPFLVMEAAKRVSVREYLQLKYQSKRGSLSKNEYRQVSDGAAAIMYDVAKSDNRPYDPGDKIEHSVDPLVIGARLVLTNVPLPTYLAARHEVLGAAIARSTRNLEELKTIEGLEEEAEKASIRKLNLEADLFLTEKVTAAAKISLSSAV